ncbi:MAG: hypothetical protein HRT61_21875, partial [Ekhidna sp.]|nr:hypothetical protein [Ekhidna sp.]
MGIKIDIGDGDGGATYVNYASTDSGSTTSTTYKEDSESRPYRRVGQRSKPAGDKAVSLYGKDNTKTVIWGSDSHSFFLDVVSIGPIGAVHAAYFNDSDVNNGEFPLSTLSSHDGTTEELPWNGDFPYVERSVSIGKVAEILDKRHTKRTTVTKQVTGLGVRAVRVNFITSAFKQLDDKGRKKAAQAIFQIYSYDASGAQVQIDTYPHTDFYCEGPTMIELTATPPTSLADQIWSYQVVMKIQGNNHGVLVQGSWSASTATEIVIDTQTYQDIAYVSGDVVASDVSGKVPKRQYLVSGYKVQVPDIVNDVYTGFFSTEVSNSHAYNAMAVITDEKWGGGRDMDSIVVTSFIDFENYCAEQIDGKRRYSHSQVLNKAENYYRTASKMVGAADGRLYQDVSGRIGVLIDRETDNRRVITSYDIEEGDMKLATVPSSKKVNYVEGTYEDKDNSYEKTIIQVRDEKAELLNGTIPKKLKLDTCTDADEALRIIKKFLAVSQLSVDTYTFNVGPSHGDIQIGEVVELYSRKYSRIDFCGKVAAGSSLTEIAVDARTPINLTGITNPILVLDNDRGVPITASISSYTSSSITLSGLSEIPTTGVSFGVRSSDASTGIQPLLCRVMDISDEGTVKRVETLAYNHSLYEHVEAGSDLIMPVTKYLPLENLGEVTSPVITKVSGGLKVDWQTNQSTWKSWVYWSVLKDNGKYEALKSQGAAAGVLTDTLVSALDTTTYKAGIAVISPDGEYTSEY